MGQMFLHVKGLQINTKSFYNLILIIVINLEINLIFFILQ